MLRICLVQRKRTQSKRPLRWGIFCLWQKPLENSASLRSCIRSFSLQCDMLAHSLNKSTRLISYALSSAPKDFLRFQFLKFLGACPELASGGLQQLRFFASLWMTTHPVSPSACHPSLSRAGSTCYGTILYLVSCLLCLVSCFQKKNTLRQAQGDNEIPHFVRNDNTIKIIIKNSLGISLLLCF